MKYFIGIKKNHKNKFWIDIYSIKKNKLEYIGEIYYNIHSTKGEQSEVYNYIINNKLIPKKAFEFSRCDWRSAGYYVYDNPYCIINIF